MSNTGRILVLVMLATQMLAVANTAKRLERESGECARQVERLRDDLQRRGRVEVSHE